MYDENIEQKLLNHNVEQQMAQYIAQFFTRDPLTLYSEEIHQDNAMETGHFEVRSTSQYSCLTSTKYVDWYKLHVSILNICKLLSKDYVV